MRTTARITDGINPGPLDQSIKARQDAAAPLGLSTREQVTRLTLSRADKSLRIARLRRLVLGAAEQQTEHLQRTGHRYRAAMLTLTYAPDHEWQPRQVSALMQRIRDYLHRRGHALRALWVMELHKSGRPHYHVMLWLPKGVTLPKPDKRGWWPHGSTRIEWARRPVAYLSKYTSKGADTGAEFPKGARIYGIYGCPVNLAWWRAPGWMRRIAEKKNVIRRLPGGWWAVPKLAMAWRSPWQVINVTGADVEIEWVGWSATDVLPLWLLEERLRPAPKIAKPPKRAGWLRHEDVYGLS